MRRGAAGAAALAVSAVILAGCGGAATDAAAPTTTDPASTPTATPNATDPSTQLTGAQAAGSTTGDSKRPPSAGSVIAAPGSQVGTSEITPKEFVKMLGSRTIVVLIQQPESDLDQLVGAETFAAASRFKGIAYLTYEAGDHEAYGDLPEQLGLYGSPAVAVINRAGQIENFWTGYVDRNLIARSILLAERTKPANITPSDAPPASEAPNSWAIAAQAAATGVQPKPKPTTPAATTTAPAAGAATTAPAATAATPAPAAAAPSDASAPTTGA